MCIYLYIKREKERERERERNWMSMMMCVWVRETSFCRREKREKRSSPRKHTKKEEIIVSFSRGEMRWLFRVNFFLKVVSFFTSLCFCIVCLLT